MLTFELLVRQRLSKCIKTNVKVCTQKKGQAFDNRYSIVMSNERNSLKHIHYLLAIDNSVYKPDIPDTLSHSTPFFLTLAQPINKATAFVNCIVLSLLLYPTIICHL